MKLLKPSNATQSVTVVSDTNRRITIAKTRNGWSGKNTHHNIGALDFVCVDGEGMTVDGEHKYVLFGVGDAQISNPAGLGFREVFEHLYSQYRPQTAFVGFYLGYDFTQIFSTMDERKAYMLLTTEGRQLRAHRIPGKAPHPVEQNGWQFDILANKRLRLRPKLCDCEYPTCKCKPKAPWMYVCDVGGFFQQSFLKVIDPKGWPAGTAVVSDSEYATILEGKGKRSTAILDEDMRRYNRLENEVLSRVMKTLDEGFRAIDVALPPSKWFGPGQAAQAWLSKEGVPKRKELDVPQWYMEAARMSYFGGWFEIMMHGIVPGVTHEYDINSAYPSIIANLPCLLHGEYTHGEGIPTDYRDGDLLLAYGRLQTPSAMDIRTAPYRKQYIGTMLHRKDDGGIYRPDFTEGWYWWDELLAAERAGCIAKLNRKTKHQRITKWVRYRPCDCPCPMRNVEGLYERRLAVGKNTPLGKGAKLTYNSEYGKFAQSVGEPVYANPVYASRITSGCRTMILNAIATHPQGQAAVAMVATDAVYFLTPHPTLPVSEKLGEWDYKAKKNLTLFKPGVYWDDDAREKIRRQESPTFKARGFNAADFATHIQSIDKAFRAWDRGNTPEWLENSLWESGWLTRSGDWPTASFTPTFAMTTALQALRRNDWSQAGRVELEPDPLVQDSDPKEKRGYLYADTFDGRTIYRSCPRHNTEREPSYPYVKRFGMDDPWSLESTESFGVTPDGPVDHILAWILIRGE